MRPKAVACDAHSSICRVTLAPPLSDSGSASTISLITWCGVVVPEHEAEDRDEDDRQRDEREEDAVRNSAACWVQRSAK